MPGQLQVRCKSASAGLNELKKINDGFACPTRAGGVGLPPPSNLVAKISQVVSLSSHRIAS